jgi:hypothetical protein
MTPPSNVIKKNFRRIGMSTSPVTTSRDFGSDPLSPYPTRDQDPPPPYPFSSFLEPTESQIDEKRASLKGRVEQGCLITWKPTRFSREYFYHLFNTPSGAHERLYCIPLVTREEFAHSMANFPYNLDMELLSVEKEEDPRIYSRCEKNIGEYKKYGDDYLEKITNIIELILRETENLPIQDRISFLKNARQEAVGKLKNPHRQRSLIQNFTRVALYRLINHIVFDINKQPRNFEKIHTYALALLTFAKLPLGSSFELPSYIQPKETPSSVRVKYVPYVQFRKVEQGFEKIPPLTHQWPNRQTALNSLINKILNRLNPDSLNDYFLLNHQALQNLLERVLISSSLNKDTHQTIDQLVQIHLSLTKIEPSLSSLHPISIREVLSPILKRFLSIEESLKLTGMQFIRTREFESFLPIQQILRSLEPIIDHCLLTEDEKISFQKALDFDPSTYIEAE